MIYAKKLKRHAINFQYWTLKNNYEYSVADKKYYKVGSRSQLLSDDELYTEYLNTLITKE